MYEELVKRLRNCATQATACEICDMVDDCACIDTLMNQAADAIEELRKLTDAQLDIIKQYQGHLTKQHFPEPPKEET